MIVRQVILALIGLSGGVITSAGVFALITSTGLMTRFAGKTRTAKSILLYEECVIWGGILGNVFSVYEITFTFPKNLAMTLIAAFGLFSGIFVGCLATSLAEALNTTAIFTRRISLKNGLGVMVLALAVGKLVGSGLQFLLGWAK